MFTSINQLSVFLGFCCENMVVVIVIVDPRTINSNLESTFSLDKKSMDVPIDLTLKVELFHMD